jgi:ABC-type molybdate transport system ATPase subunit
MVKSIDRLAFSGGLFRYCSKDFVFNEAMIHNNFAVNKNKSFVSTTITNESINRLIEFVKNKVSPAPLKDKSGEITFQCSNKSCPYFTVIGKSGTGKTSLMANAFVAIKKSFPNSNVIIR